MQTALLGFMNGLAIVIFLAQMTAFKKCDEFELFGDCRCACVRLIAILVYFNVESPLFFIVEI